MFCELLLHPEPLKKVLIVTPNWPPVSCPDLHRVRMALPFFREFGWEPLILKINPEEQEGIKDPLLCRTVPESLRAWQAGCVPLRLTKWAGVRNVGLRSVYSLAQLGRGIIRNEKPQLVFFSTTMFPLMTLGGHWHRRCGVPYVLDFQDPWRRENRVTGEKEGGSFKSRMAERTAKFLEPIALRGVSRLVSVSPAYITALCDRYSWLRETQFTVLPFGAAEKDYEVLRELHVNQEIFSKDGKWHWVYAGAFIREMNLALRSFFAALAQAIEKEPVVRSKLKLHFIGTNYAPRERAVKMVEPIARELGLANIVEEITDRQPYFQTLQCLLDADALIVPGSDDPGYTASKIYPCILAKKPLLAIFREESSVVDVLTKTKAGTVVTFKSGDQPEVVAGRILKSGWLDSTLCSPRPMIPPTDWTAFEPYTAREMTRRLCEVFDHAANGN